MSITHLSLFQRSNGVWYFLFRQDGRHQLKSIGKRVKHEALKVLASFRGNIPTNPPDQLFSVFVSQFKALQSTYLRESTLQRIYLPTFRTFIRICGNKSLRQYSLRDIEHFKAERLKSCSPETVSMEFRSLRSSFNLAVKWGMLRDNPCLLASPVRKNEQRPVYLGKENFQRLMGYVREPVLRDVFCFAASTGMRQGEILNLQWKDIEFSKKIVTVAGGERFTTKTGKIRVIPMSDSVFDILSRRRLAPAQYVFHRNGFPLLRDYVCHKFKAYVRAAGIDDKLHFHSLRHTFASWLVQDGVSLYEVR